MASQELKRMRFEQVERYLASDGMTVKEWCELNHLAQSTLYLWMRRYREEVGGRKDGLNEAQKHKATSEWIEVSRREIADACALSVVTSGPVKPEAANASPDSMRAGGHEPLARGVGNFDSSQIGLPSHPMGPSDALAPIVVSLAGINVGIPPGSRASDIEAVLKAVHAL